jgi:hypothetical protein
LLFVVIVLVAVGLGWVRPGLFFYVATSVVGLLVLLDFQRNREAVRPEVPADADETTTPDVHGGDGAAR